MTPTCSSCPQHGRVSKGMKHLKEFDAGHTFECQTCGSIGFFTKSLVGGTLGSGARGDGVRGVSSGFGNGTVTYRGVVR